MAGILKVDTLQRVGSDSDQITLSANTVAIGGTTLKVPTTIQNTAGTTAMTIDTAGRVLQPTKPAFHATSTGSGFTHNQTLVFNTAHLNVGSCYDTSTGKFTAPVAGVYFFYHKNIGTSVSTVLRVKVYYNDSVFSSYKTIATRQDTSTGNDYAEGVLNFVVSLNANDTIHLFLTADNGSSGIYNDNSGGQGFNYFGGYLIG